MPTQDWLALYLRPKQIHLASQAIPQWEDGLEEFSDAAEQLRSRLGGRHSQLKNALRGPKSLFAPGALDSRIRSEVLDAIGLEYQIVFSTFVAPRLSNPGWATDDIEDIVKAHNLGIADFCARDSRIFGVGIVSFHDPARALRDARWALKHGLRVLQVPTDAFWQRSPSHSKLEAFWEYCATEGILVASHIGGGVLLPEAYHVRGQSSSARPDHHLRPKDFAVMHHTVERFLTCMILDGVLERYPALRIGIMEQGASWLPGFMKHLDHAAMHFRSDPGISRLRKLPSEYIKEQVKVTPFFFEDIGELIQTLGDDQLLMFSTDYPHFEGGQDPIGRFRKSLSRNNLLSRSGHRFFYRNLKELLRI